VSVSITRHDPEAGSVLKRGLPPLRPAGLFVFKDSIRCLNQKYLLFVVFVCPSAWFRRLRSSQRHCESGGGRGGERLSGLIQADVWGRQDGALRAKSRKIRARDPPCTWAALVKELELRAR